jgi:hypothetical protein
LSEIPPRSWRSTCTTRAAPRSPTRWSGSSSGSAISTRRSPASAAARTRPARPATWRPKTGVHVGRPGVKTGVISRAADRSRTHAPKVCSATSYPGKVHQAGPRVLRPA